MTFYVPHDRQPFHTGDDSHVRQSFKAECDINTILSQYRRTGMLTHVATARALYADLPDQIDFQGALELVRRSEEAFSELPSPIRDRFGNDPQALLAAIHSADPKLRAELVELGVIRAPEPSPAAAPAPGSSA